MARFCFPGVHSNRKCVEDAGNMHYNALGMASKIPEIECLACGTKFRQNRPWQSFCSKACRVGSRRDRIPGKYSCGYCGLPSTGLDHVPPRCVRQTLIDLGIEDRTPFVEVRCCSECNSALGDRAFWTVQTRRDFLCDWISRKYRKYLNIPDWDGEDLCESGRGVSDFVKQGLSVKKVTMLRLSRLRRKA